MGSEPLGSRAVDAVTAVTATVPVSWEAEVDLVVVGGGVAGLTAARTASLRGLRVLILSKGGPTDTSTQYAQGGIAVVAPRGDSVDSHVLDTVEAGAGLCEVDAVRSIVEGGQAAVAALTDLGAVFDLGRDGQISRTREGGHSTRRIIHAGGDATGAEVQRALNAAGLPVLFGAAALRVLTGPDGVCGVVAVSPDGFGVVRSPAVLLATGGLGQLYASSTNPPGATGDGVALALWAGAAVADLEFVQFHPTVLYTPGGVGRRPLISEAVRGEGAILLDAHGDSVTAGVHPRGDLAPRDVVSRAIAERMRATGTDHVFLDARHLTGFAQRFPTITASCLAAGIDPATQLIPVAPGAHYQCGGVLTDTHGRTGVPGLYAAGEVARTGLHGANRLASNSLLEGLVVGERAGAAASERLGLRTDLGDIDSWTLEFADRGVVQQAMTEHASVVRDGTGLTAALATIDAARSTASPLDAAAAGSPRRASAPNRETGYHPEDSGHARPAPFPVDAAPDSARTTANETADVPEGFDSARVLRWVEDAALTLTARALLIAAADRAESRGCHTRAEYQGPVDGRRHSTAIRLNADGELEVRAEASVPVGEALPVRSGPAPLIAR